MKFILSYMKKTWLFILITMVIKFIGTFLELLIPYVLEYIIDSVAPQESLKLVLGWCHGHTCCTL